MKVVRYREVNELRFHPDAFALEWPPAEPKHTQPPVGATCGWCGLVIAEGETHGEIKLGREGHSVNCLVKVRVLQPEFVCRVVS